MKEALLIFTKNMMYGKVKTRLAATTGNKKAFEVYQQLVQHTQAITSSLPVDKYVHYSDYIEDDDVWNDGYTKQLQYGNDLGERMSNAFENLFKQNYNKVIIIGTDCPEINAAIITEAFHQLSGNDVVVGPATDGGYYLIGMQQLQSPIFLNIEWSSNKVFSSTLERCSDNNLSYALLPELHDVDEEQDLPYLKRIVNA